MNNIENIKDIFRDYRIGINGEEDMKRCSVLIPVVNIDGEDNIIFEIRNNKLNSNPGEICFPGGAIEEGETPKEAALRECFEEIGLGEENLDYVVAKYRSSSDFGELGNVILAAHNNMRGSIFRNLHKLKIGSTVKIISDNKELEYKITNRYIVEPNDTSKINFSNDKKEITLITCINHAKQRLILTGELVNFNLVLKIK